MRTDRKLLTPAALHILLSLARADLHGYALMQAVAESSAGRVTLRTGSLYRHLAALLEEGLVVDVAPPAHDDPRRSAYYRITADGRTALAAHRAYFKDVVAVIDTLPAIPRRSAP